MLRVGDKLGAYEIVSDFKSGGMATLYLARRVGTSGFARLVALKAIHPHLAKDEAFVRMFVDEALLSVRIEHPNVVRVEELGEHERVPFLVMEYVHGCSLAQLLTELARRGESMLPEVATYIAIQIADGLHAAHETRGFDGELLGVVHRDISPQNVLLGASGAVKVIDFGIAKARGRGLHTTTGTVKGKFRYMSPEQSRGEPVDRRTDLFALGIVLWEMLTSRRLFDAPNDAMVIDQVRRPVVTPPSKLVAGIAPGLDRAVLASLSGERERRPASAIELRKLLAQAVPDALRVSGTEVSTLVTGVMGDEMRRQHEELPESVRVMLRGVTPSLGPSGGEHPLALPPEIVGSAGREGASARELAETMIESAEAHRRPVVVARPLGGLPATVADQAAIPPAVVTPSVVTGQSIVAPIRRRRPRAPILAGLGVAGLAVAVAALLATRPWEAGAPPSGLDTVRALGAAAPSAPASRPNVPASRARGAAAGSTSAAAPATTTSAAAPATTTGAALPLGLAAPMRAAGSASEATRDAGTRSPGASTERADRGRARRLAPPRGERPARSRGAGRGGGLVDGVPIAEGFGP